MGMDIQNIASNSEMADLLEILEEITAIPVDEETKLEEGELEQFWQRFKLIYSKNFRHSYSNISKFLERCSPDILSSIPSFLQRLVEYSSCKHRRSEDEIAVKGLKKLSDHIELECIRLDRMAVVKETAKDIQLRCEQVQKLSKSTKEQSDDVKKQAKEFHGQSIAILSIFSAVTLTFLGGSDVFLAHILHHVLTKIIVLALHHDLFALCYTSLVHYVDGIYSKIHHVAYIAHSMCQQPDIHYLHRLALFAFSGCALLWHAAHRLIRLLSVYPSSGCVSACSIWCTTVACTLRPYLLHHWHIYLSLRMMPFCLCCHLLPL